VCSANFSLSQAEGTVRARAFHRQAVMKTISRLNGKPDKVLDRQSITMPGAASRLFIASSFLSNADAAFHQVDHHACTKGQETGPVAHRAKSGWSIHLYLTMAGF